MDLRKPPTPAQKRAIKRYADVISGRAKVLKPKNPKSYRRLFKVSGNRVIVPRRKGERVKVGREGYIEVARKIGGRKRTGRYKKISELIEGGGKLYFLPLMHGSGIEWYQFGSRDELNKFVFETSPKVGETFKNFASYVLEVSELAYDEGGEEYLEEKLDRQIARRLRANKRRRRK